LIGCPAVCCFNLHAPSSVRCSGILVHENIRQMVVVRHGAPRAGAPVQRRRGGQFYAALIASLVIGLLDTLLRPVLVLLTLPVTILTLGLFLFVINALMFWFAANVLDGFQVRDFGAALGSLALRDGHRDRLSAPSTALLFPR